MQPVDFTTLFASCCELRQLILPARLEQVYQRDRWTVCLALRTFEGRRWLSLAWHPQAARIAIEDAPPKQPDTFTFSQQIWHQLGRLALVEIEISTPWERVVDLRFAKRPGDPIAGHIYIEIMGQYSNAVLVNQENQIVSAAHQVSDRQSRLRAIQTGGIYEFPPTLVSDTPSLSEDFTSWQEKITLVPGKLRKIMTSLYRGLSSSLLRSMLETASMDWNISTEDITGDQWQELFGTWKFWLKSLEKGDFFPNWTESGYSVIAWQNYPEIKNSSHTTDLSLQTVLKEYYGHHLAATQFQQIQNQLFSKLQSILKRLYGKRQEFVDRLADSSKTVTVRQQADLLMAHLNEWQPGMAEIQLHEFDGDAIVTIPLSPDKNAVQNAQTLYKKHQKLKRSRGVILPLLENVEAEIAYLEQVQTAIGQVEKYQTAADLTAIAEIRDELVAAGYLASSEYQRPNANPDSATQPRCFRSPSGYDIFVGRNNRQNDQLTFRTATDYDLWFHTQQIPGSHVLLRLPAGAEPSNADLQVTADLATYFSQARDSDQAPIVYTAPKHVYKPKGAQLGMVIYKHETVLWGNPQQGKAIVAAQSLQSSPD